MKKWICLLTLLISTSTFAMGDKGPHEKGTPKKHLQKMAKELGLSNEQIDKLKALKKESFKETRSLRKEVKQAKSEFDAIIESEEKGDSFKTKAKAAFSKLEVAKSKMMQMRFNESLELREILTAEQLKKFNQMRKDHGPKFKRHKK